MHVSCKALALITVLLAAGQASAQGSSAKPPVEHSTPTAAAGREGMIDPSRLSGRPTQSQVRMHEDIEIMRRLLAKGVQQLTTAGVSLVDAVDMGSGKLLIGGMGEHVDFDNDGWLDLAVSNTAQSLPKDAGGLAGVSRATTLVGAGDGQTIGLLMGRGAHHGLDSQAVVEGHYLRGHGVVYSISMPVHFVTARRTKKSPAAAPLSDWERIRKELRGEKAPQARQASQRRSDSLLDTLLSVLSVNGHNISQLQEQENLSIAVTLRHNSQCGTCHEGPVAGARGIGMMGDMAGSQGVSGAEMAPGMGASSASGTVLRLHGLLSGAAGTGSGSASGISPSGSTTATTKPDLSASESDAQNQILLGDLYTRQGRLKDALSSYQKAVDVYQKSLKSPQNQLPVRQVLTVMEYYNKLAQGAVAAGDKKEALRAFARLAEYAKSIEERAASLEKGQGAKAVADAMLSQLPSKLIITVPKKWLDSAASRRMSLEEFKKGVSVEYLVFSSAVNPGSTSGSNRPGGGRAGGAVGGQPIP